MALSVVWKREDGFAERQSEGFHEAGMDKAGKILTGDTEGSTE